MKTTPFSFLPHVRWPIFGSVKTSTFYAAASFEEVVFGAQCKVWVPPCFGTDSTWSDSCFPKFETNLFLKTISQIILGQRLTQVAKALDIFKRSLFHNVVWLGRIPVHVNSRTATIFLWAKPTLRKNLQAATKWYISDWSPILLSVVKTASSIKTTCYVPECSECFVWHVILQGWAMCHLLWGCVKISNTDVFLAIVMECMAENSTEVDYKQRWNQNTDLLYSTF